MNVLRGIGSELLGLFVDDWAFALLIVAWVAAFGLFGPRLPPHSPLPAVVFLAGLAALTLAFVVRRARQ